MTDLATFQLQTFDGTPVVAVTGEIDVANVGQFTSFVTDAAANESGPLVISFESVSYIDSHTLAALVDISKRLRTNRRRLLVVAPKDSPSGRIMRLTGIELAIELFESVDDALQNLK